LNSAVSSLKKPELIPSPIPKKEIRAKLNMHACPPCRAKRRQAGSCDGMRVERAFGALAEFIVSHYRSVVKSFEK